MQDTLRWSEVQGLELYQAWYLEHSEISTDTLWAAGQLPQLGG